VTYGSEKQKPAMAIVVFGDGGSQPLLPWLAREWLLPFLLWGMAGAAFSIPFA
jgi:hypothetical protein